MPRKIAVEIVGDASSLQKAFAKSERSAKGFNQDMEKTGRRGRSVFGGLGKGIGLAAGAIGTAGLVGAAKAAFSEFSEAQKVSAQTAAALKSTGGAAHVTAKQIDALADSMLKKTGIDDEAIKTSENMLLTFTHIRNETGKGNKIFDRATGAVADLATAMNQGAVPSADQMQRASIQLGKALNDPVKGIGALSRVGIQFTDQQKKQIKTLVASGKTMQAQKIILAELNKEVGGRAAAAGKTFAGQWKILTETLNNLGGELAAKLMPTIQKYLQMAVKWLSNSKNQKTIIDAVTTAARVLGGALRILKAVFDTLSTVVGGNKNALKLLIAAFVAFKALQVASSVSNMARSFGLLNTNMRKANTTGGALKGTLGKAGLAASVGVLSFELTTAILKATGLDKKLKDLGASAFDLAAKLGLVNDANKQFEGKTTPTPAIMRFLRNQAALLERRGMTPRRAAARIVATHPNVALRDAQVAAGVFGRAPVYQIQNLNVHGVQNPRQLENELTKRQKGRPHRRRGA